MPERPGNYGIAYSNVTCISSTPTNDEQLELYALSKVADGEDITSKPAVGVFDFKEKAKRKQWQKVVDEGISQEAARQKYVEAFKALAKKYGLNDDAPPAVKAIVG